MKAICVGLIALMASTASADWAALSKKALIEAADAIVVATLDKELSSKTSEHMKTQTVSFVVRDILKGVVSKRIVVNGMKSSMCAPQVYFDVKKKQSYLLFLRKGKDGDYHVVNGDLGAPAIVDKSVSWFKPGTTGAWPREPQSFTVVKAEIARLVADSADR